MLLALLCAPPVAEAGLDGVSRRVDEVLETWSENPVLPSEQLGERLVAIGPEAVPYLSSLLSDRRSTLPVEAIASALGRLGKGEAVEPLSSLLASPEARHRASAAAALGGTGSAEAIEHVMDALSDEHVRVRFAAYPALVRLTEVDRRPEVVSELARALEENEHKDGYALALAHLAGPAARAALHELAEERFDEEVALAALCGLWAVPQQGDAAIVHPLVQSASSKPVCKKACLLMGRLRYAPAARDLIDLLYDRDAGLAKDAHWALIQITGNRIKADPELWEAWWERVGSQAAG